jgi:hypothetical protein
VNGFRLTSLTLMIASYKLFCVRLKGILGGIEEEEKKLRQSCSWEYLSGRSTVINVGRCVELPPSSPHGGVPGQLTNHRAFLINGKRHQKTDADYLAFIILN